MIIEDYNTQLCHTPSFTYHFVTHTHTTLSHTFVLHGRRGTFSLRGRRGTCGTGLALVARLGLGAAGRRWRHGTLRGRRGNWRHPPSFCVAGVALGDIYILYTFSLRGKRGTYGTGLALVARLGAASGRDAAALCVAGVALASFSCALPYTIFHTNNCVTYIFHTHTTLSHTTVHIQFFLTSRSSTNSFVFPSLPVPLQLLFLLIGRSWPMGLSGPLVFFFPHPILGMDSHSFPWIVVIITRKPDRRMSIGQ